MNPRKFHSEEYYQIVKSIYDLIVSEIGQYTPSDLQLAYPKLVIMYQFFRLLRGESFISLRTGTISEHQKEYYEMENSLRKKLEEIKSHLNKSNSMSQFYVDAMKKEFDLS